MDSIEKLENAKVELQTQIAKIERELKENRKSRIHQYLSEYHDLKSKETEILKKIKKTDIHAWAKLMGPSYVRMVNCPTGDCTVNEIYRCCDTF